MIRETSKLKWPGCFITFEGMDGSGKTTQIDALSHYLDTQNITHIKTREPGGCPFSEHLRNLLLSNAAKEITPLTQALLIAGARIEHIKHTIKPALDKGAWVLCDRFMDSTTVYQGYVQQVSLKHIQQIHDVSVGPFVPDFTFIFTLSPDVARTRLSQKADNHFDTRTFDFHQKVQAGFLELARQDPHRFRCINADLDKSQITNALIKALAPYI